MQLFRRGYGTIWYSARTAVAENYRRCCSAHAESAARCIITSPRSEQLAWLAEESLRDGALNEGWAAAIAQRAAKAAHPATASLLVTIAKDEHQHTELGWQVVAFCLAQGGTEVATRLAQTLSALLTHVSLRDQPAVSPCYSKPVACHQARQSLLIVTPAPPFYSEATSYFQHSQEPSR